MICEFFNNDRYLGHSLMHVSFGSQKLATLKDSLIWDLDLSNFSCKILNSRLSKVINKILSPNQAGFLKGRSISKNIPLTQEMVHNIKKANTNGHVIIKLDMAKTFDKMDWKYLCHALSKFDFNEQWISRDLETFMPGNIFWQSGLEISPCGLQI